MPTTLSSTHEKVNSTTTQHANGKPPHQDSKAPTERIADHILTALAAINDEPDAVFELSILRNVRGRDLLDKGYYSDRLALAQEAARQTLKPGSIAVYVNLQEIKADCLHRAHNRMSEQAKPMSAADVTRYTRFLIDVDRAGVKGISATDAEKAEIRDALEAIKEFLLQQGWPDPKFEGDSGNGGHIAWLLDLPATRETQDLLSTCYKALQQKFGCATLSIDSSLADPNQLIKLYGTMTRKGDHTPDRPHRFSKLLNTYETEPVTLDQLRALAALYAAPAQEKPGRGGVRTYWKAGTPEAVEEWAAGHGIPLGKREKDSHPQTGEGWKWRVDCLTSSEHKDGAALFLNAKGNLKYKCHHASCADKSETYVLALYPAPAGNAGKTDRVTWADYAGAIESLGYTLRMNELDDRVEVNGQALSDGIEAELLMRMCDVGYDKAEWVQRAIKATAHQNRYHPLRDFLNGLAWDGIDHIDYLAGFIEDAHPHIIYADGSNQAVFSAWLRRWGIGAVGKVLSAGTVRTQNPMLVFAGAQDVGKSTLARFLCPLPDTHYIESHINPESGDHLRYLASCLVWEVAELGATTRRADREALKAFLTRQDVTFRVPYARHPVTKPAMSSFIGTINPETGFLNDPSGHRRFLPVELTSIDFAYRTKVDPVQLWAQFVALYRAGESPNLTPEEKKMADLIRMQHETEDNYAGFIAKFYDINPSEATPGGSLEWSAATADIVEQLRINGVHDANVTNVGISLRRLGLVNKERKVNGVRQTRWHGLQRNAEGLTFRVR